MSIEKIAAQFGERFHAKVTISEQVDPNTHESYPYLLVYKPASEIDSRRQELRREMKSFVRSLAGESIAFQLIGE